MFHFTHWPFLDDADPKNKNIAVDRLCGRLFLLSDRDGAGLKKDGNPRSGKQKKYERHEKLKAKLGERYFCLESREIENLLSPEILKVVIEKYEKNNFDSVKFSNWEQKKYKDIGIGRFLDKNIANSKRTYAAKSGTINDKLKFAKRAVSSMNSYDDLSKEAKKLTEKIYEFIKSQNEI